MKRDGLKFIIFDPTATLTVVRLPRGNVRVEVEPRRGERRVFVFRLSKMVAGMLVDHLTEPPLPKKRRAAKEGA